MKIKTQFLLTMVLFGIIFFIIIFSVISANRQIAELFRQEEIAHRVERGASDLSYLSYDYLLFRESQQRIRLESAYSSFLQSLDELKPNNAQQRALINNIRSNQQRWRDIFTNVVSASESSSGARGGEGDFSFIQVSGSRMGVQSRGIVFDSLRLAHLFDEQKEQLRRRNTFLIFSFLGLFAVYFIANYLIVHRRILKLFEELLKGTDIVGSGNLDYAINDKSRDEVGILARAFNRMTASLKHLTTSKAELESEIVERRKVEEQLTRQEQRYHGTLDTMMEGCQLIDHEWHYLYINDAAARQGHSTRDDLLGRTMMEMFPGFEHTPIYAELALCMKERTPRRLDNEFTYPDGSKGLFELSIQPVPEGLFILSLDTTERSKAEKALIEAHDELEQRVEERTHELIEINRALQAEIADRIRMEEALSAERQRFSEVLDMLPAYLVLLSPEYEVPFANRYFRERFGEAEGRKCFRYLFDRTEPCEVCETFKVLKTLAPLQWEWTGPDGRYYQIHDFPFPAGDGSTLIMEVGIDITERKKAEEALQKAYDELEIRVQERTRDLMHSNRELELFTHMASHDLQEPLRKITAFGDRLRSQFGDRLDEKGSDYLSRMEKAAQRMRQLIDGILRLSRVGMKPVEMKKVQLSKVLEEVKSDLEVRIRETGATIEAGELPVIEADPPQMALLLMNLVGNALKFCKVSPMITIACLPLNDAAYEISIMDNGIGFDTKYLDTIFKPFQQLNDRGEFEGIGMGLAICQRIVSRHNGTITARSAPGTGTTFIITLPVSQSG